MTKTETFDLRDFTPYLLNLAAESSSLQFQTYYRQKYRMLRTEWRVVFHLGRYGPMHAKQICDRARIHKTKVSRAVSALEEKGFLTRRIEDADRRHAVLELTDEGAAVFKELFAAAQEFDSALMSDFSNDEKVLVKRLLRKLAALEE
ncbi:MAG: MarR family transcriptional regulator [Pseudomonadota bacterium]